jgi:hypothetical protein
LVTTELSSTASFGLRSWYTTEKDPAGPYLSGQLCCDVERSLLLFVVRPKLQPLSWPIELVQTTDAFKYCVSAVQVAVVLLKGSCNVPFKTFVMLRAVVVLLFVEVERNASCLTMAVQVTVQATIAFKLLNSVGTQLVYY